MGHPGEEEEVNYQIPGAMELSGIPVDVKAKLEEGDSVTDNDGRGRTVYVNACWTCGKLYLAGTRHLVPTLGPECSRAVGF